MPLIMSAQHLVESLKTSVAAFAGFKIGLYQNDITPTVNTVITDLTLCDYGGYPGEIEFDAWPEDGVTIAGSIATAVYPEVSFPADGSSSNDVFGYYVVDQDNFLRWMEPNPSGPVTVGSVGDVYLVTPRYSRRQLS